MKKYRKKPVEITAIQFVDDVAVIYQIYEWVGAELSIDYGQSPPVLRVHTLEGVMTAQVGDYIIRGVAGEFYPCKPDIFEATYEAVSAVE